MPRNDGRLEIANVVKTSEIWCMNKNSRIM